MNVTLGEKDLSRCPALSLSLFEEEINQNFSFSFLPKELNEWLHSILSQKDFKGKFTETHLTYPNKIGMPERVLLLGLGKKKDFHWDKFRQTVGRAANCFAKSEAKYFVLALPGEGRWKEFNLAKAVRESALAYTLASYQFLNYRAKGNNSETKKKFKPIHLLTSSRASQSSLEKEIEKGVILGESTNLTRDLVNHPSSFMTPTRLAQMASKVGDKKTLKCRILDKNQIEKLGMGGLLGVSRGSHEPPKFIVMEYLPQKRGPKPLVFVGKGITFDTGGISIKPSSGMDQMKYDMAGGAAVIGAMAAISRLKIQRNVVGLIPTSENMPDGQAYKPGDVLKMMSGKTVEVLNTDAEGRLILADALTYSQKYKPSAIVDLATLTGACIVALGDVAIGMMGNNSRVLKAVESSGNESFERVWELPMWEEYRDGVKGDIADLKNIGAGRKAGTIAGAVFLQEFVEETPWVHLDIAGTAWTDKDKPYHPKGATGVGVRLLTDLATHWKK